MKAWQVLSSSALLCFWTAAFGIESDGNQPYDPAVVSQVESKYQINEAAAISRLDNEYVAAVQASRVESWQLPSFGGAWFDATTQILQVALSDGTAVNAVQRLGAHARLVSHSLAELEATRSAAVNLSELMIGVGSVRESYTAVETNEIVLGVSQTEVNAVNEVVRTHFAASPIRVVTVSDNVGFSSNLLGADGTQNHSWVVTYGGQHPCSVGATTEKVSGTTYTAGFATAGHCVSINDVIWTAAGVNLGIARYSSFEDAPYGFQNHQDGAWVETVSGWTPQPQVNGYSSGTLNVSGTWAGVLDGPVGTTACRYGSASGGPHCAAITARNVTACLAYCTSTPVNIQGLIKVNGICTNDGDSGGTLITAANQIQGTVTGGTANSCPDDSADYVYFQPIRTTISSGSSSLTKPLAMLTSHGRSAPTIPQILCPDQANSGATGGGHVYACDIPSYDSQGTTTISWTSSTGASSSDIELDGSCTVPGPTVSVTLTISNPYGTFTQTKSFACPTKPLP